ncbi:Glutathione S-transferase GST-6.0 [Alphaproteobacteria bacterium SO-S41]|nr:Glutathione S-transferase GST-6.0 [Alphaproteobacteria bacterium SO-S41]
MKLYFAPGACSLSPHIVLRELGFDFEMEKVDARAKKTAAGGDYYEINPKGQVPALKLDSGDVLTEGPAIVQYLADQKPEAGLAPKNGTLARARLQETLNFLTSEVHKGFGPLFAGGSDEAKKAAVENLGRKFGYLEKQFADGRDYLMGKDFSVADAYLFTLLNWTGFVGIDMKQWDKLAAYHARVGARPKVQEALAAETKARAT